MNTLCRSILRNQTKLRRQIFHGYILPRFVWIFPIWFFITEKQKQHLIQTYIKGIKIIHDLTNWDDLAAEIISNEKTLYDYLYTYWRKFSFHLEQSPDATQYMQTWTAYQAAKDPDRTWYRSMGLREIIFL